MTINLNQGAIRVRWCVGPLSDDQILQLIIQFRKLIIVGHKQEEGNSESSEVPAGNQIDTPQISHRHNDSDENKETLLVVFFGLFG